jgi:hypothetical protein
VGDGVSVGGLPINSGGGSGVTEIIAGSNITVNTSTGAVTINAVVPESTSTFASVQIGTGTYKMFIGQSPDPFNNQFYITGNEQPTDRLFFDQWQSVEFNNTTTINSIANIQSLNIELNTGTNFRDFGYGSMPYNANNMKIELPNNGSSLFFAFKNPSGAQRNIGFSRQGNIVTQNGSIFVGFPNGIGLQSLDGGPATVGVSTTTGGVVYSSRMGANTSTGVFQTVQTNAGVNFSTLLDYTGLFTVPRDLVVTTTATLATLKFGDGTTMTTAPTAGVAGDQSVYTTSSVTFDTLAVTNTATANEVVVGADLKAIKSQGFNVIGVDGNWRVGNVLEVGTGDGQGYITSTGNNSLKLQSSANDGPGGSIDIGYGDGAGVSLYSGASQEFNTAFFNTTSNTINYGLTVNGNTTINGITTINSATTFNADPVINVNNTLTLAGMTIGLSNSVLIPNAILSSATNVLIQTPPTNGGHIIFGMNRFGLQRPIAITRTGGIAFDFGQSIAPGQGANVGQLLVQAASTSTGTANTLFLTSGGITGSGPLARGVFSDAAGFTVGTRPSGGATAFNSSVFDLNGGLTLPKSLAVGTTATVTTTMILPVYTVASLTAITGVVGSVAVVSDSASGGNPNGMMAFWDTSNARWSYVHDNSAV